MIIVISGEEKNVGVDVEADVIVVNDRSAWEVGGGGGSVKTCLRTSPCYFKKKKKKKKKKKNVNRKIQNIIYIWSMNE